MKLAFELAPSKQMPFDYEALSQHENDAFGTHRQNLPGEFSLSWKMSSFPNVFGYRPATKIAHDWLRRDLQALGWELRP